MSVVSYSSSQVNLTKTTGVGEEDLALLLVLSRHAVLFCCCCGGKLGKRGWSKKISTDDKDLRTGGRGVWAMRLVVRSPLVT